MDKKRDEMMEEILSHLAFNQRSDESREKL